MYICLECGMVTPELAKWNEPHGEEMAGCPRCYGACVRAEMCSNCDKWMPAEDGDLCELCQDDVVQRLHWLLNNEFTEAERNWLYDWLDCTPLKCRDEHG